MYCPCNVYKARLICCLTGTCLIGHVRYIAQIGIESTPILWEDVRELNCMVLLH